MSEITFEYSTTTTTLSTSSSVLKADDLLPTNVVKKSGYIWSVSYLLSDVLKKANRVNALYTIFCSSSQNSDYNSSVFTQLRIDFCMQPEDYPSIYCPDITDYNNLNTNTCSRLYSTNNDFNNSNISNKVQCSGLVGHLNVSSTDDTMKTAVQNGYKSFCLANKNMRECQCYNRANFEAYKNAYSILSNGSVMQSGNESCWYIPCQYQTNITVDTDIQNAYNRIECPSVCQNIVAAVNVKNVNLSDISLSNNCIGTSTDVIKKDISANVSNEKTNTLFKEVATTPTTTSPPSGKPSWIMIVVVVCIVVVVIMVLIAMIVVVSTQNRGD